MNENRQNTTLLTVIAVATLLVAVVGATFAYFTANVQTDTSTSTIETTGGKIGITYANQTAWMEAVDIEPNTSEHVTYKDFTITANYDVKLDIPFSIVLTYNTKFSYPMYVALTDNTTTNTDKYEFNATLPTYNKETGVGTKKLLQANKDVLIDNREAVSESLTVASGKFLGQTPGEYSIKLTIEIFYPDNGSIQDEDKKATFEGKVSVLTDKATPSAA